MHTRGYIYYCPKRKFSTLTISVLTALCFYMSQEAFAWSQEEKVFHTYNQRTYSFMILYVPRGIRLVPGGHF